MDVEIADSGCFDLHVPKLTKKQIEVIDLASKGLRQTEIAVKVGISIRQVYRITKEARETLGVQSNHELMAKAISEGLLDGTRRKRRGSRGK